MLAQVCDQPVSAWYIPYTLCPSSTGDAAETAVASPATLDYIHAADQQADALVLAFSCPCLTTIMAEGKHGSSMAPACTIASCALCAMQQSARMSSGPSPLLTGMLCSRPDSNCCMLCNDSCLYAVLLGPGTLWAPTVVCCCSCCASVSNLISNPSHA